MATTAPAPPVVWEGSERLREDLELMTTVWRRGIAERLREARWSGDVAGSPDLSDVFEEQLSRARAAHSGSVDAPALLGTRVRLDDLEHEETLKYELVPAIEADPGAGKLSVASPLGRALLGHRAGDVVELDDPSRGATRFQIRGVTPRSGRGLRLKSRS